jgi:hypothetical protein
MWGSDAQLYGFSAIMARDTSEHDFEVMLQNISD